MDITTLAVLGLALAAGSIVKGATGMGMPLVAIPIITSIFGLQHAIAVLALPIIVTNLWQVYRYFGQRSDTRLRFLAPMLAGCAVGIGFGTWFLTSAPERVLAVVLGVLLLAYLGLRLARPNFVVGAQAARKWALPAGLGAGMLQGATGISAPIGVTFIHTQRFERDAHVFAVSAMFLALSLTQLPALVVAGVMRPEWWIQGVLSLIPIAVFMPIGQWLGSKLSPAAFDKIILAFLGIIGVKMLVGI